jgi:hypothetical protein
MRRRCIMAAFPYGCGCSLAACVWPVHTVKRHCSFHAICFGGEGGEGKEAPIHINDGGSSQNLMLFIRGDAISGSRNINSINQFPNPPIIN